MIGCKVEVPKLGDVYLLIEGGLSSEITYIEFDFANKLRIGDLKIIPVCMSSSVCVDSHEHIELLLIFLDDEIEVSCFEVGVELQRAVV